MYLTDTHTHTHTAVWLCLVFLQIVLLSFVPSVLFLLACAAVRLLNVDWCQLVPTGADWCRPRLHQDQYYCWLFALEHLLREDSHTEVPESC